MVDANPALESNLITRVNVGDALTRTAARLPAKLALVDGPRRWTYAELNDWTNRLANGLLGLGYGRSDVIALASGNSAEFMATYFACAKIGVVCVPINLGWNATEVAYVLTHSGARGIVVEAQLVPQMTPAVARVPEVRDVIVAPGTGGSAEPADRMGRDWRTFAATLAGTVTEPEVFVDERDPVSFLYTSGTTSAPKSVESSHVAIYLQSLMIAVETTMTGEDRIAALMPLFHTAQLNAIGTPAVLVGATVHLLRGFDAETLLDCLECERITRFFALPMMFRALVEHPSVGRRDFSALRKANYAMAPMPKDLLTRCLDVFGCEFFLCFGQTEMSPVTTVFRPEHQLSHPGAVGTQVVNVQIEIMGPDGALQARGTQGEIVYRGPQALTGYRNDPEASGKAFAHGWFHSGDFGHLGEDGMLWFNDREKDVIKSGGENVASLEVEKAVYDVASGVAEVAVVGLPHERWAEAITAVVVAKPGEQLEEAELLAALRGHLAGFKIPKSVIVVDELPKTSTGKIRKTEVRTKFVDHYQRM